jgi:hypothetical protein
MNSGNSPKLKAAALGKSHFIADLQVQIISLHSSWLVFLFVLCFFFFFGGQC